MQRSRAFWTAAFLAVPLLIYSIIVVGPLLYSLFFSITDSNGLSSVYHFVGLANFANIFTDPLFANAFRNTLIWTAAAVLVPTLAGLTLAVALHEGVRGSKVLKSLFYLPTALSLAVIGQVWIWIYQPQWGLLNDALRAIGLGNLATAWLGDPSVALASVIVAWAWQQTGLAMVIFLAGLTAVPAELTEAAQMDGANWWQTLRQVVIPMLRPATTVVVALNVINSLKSFDIVYIMTQGGPFHSTDNLAMYMYDQTFSNYNMGYGSAIAVVLFVIAMTVVTLYFRRLRSMEHLYN